MKTIQRVESILRPIAYSNYNSSDFRSLICFVLNLWIYQLSKFQMKQILLIRSQQNCTFNISPTKRNDPNRASFLIISCKSSWIIFFRRRTCLYQILDLDNILGSQGAVSMQSIHQFCSHFSILLDLWTSAQIQKDSPKNVQKIVKFPCAILTLLMSRNN